LTEDAAKASASPSLGAETVKGAKEEEEEASGLLAGSGEDKAERGQAAASPAPAPSTLSPTPLSLPHQPPRPPLQRGWAPLLLLGAAGVALPTLVSFLFDGAPRLLDIHTRLAARGSDLFVGACMLAFAVGFFPYVARTGGVSMLAVSRPAASRGGPTSSSPPRAVVDGRSDSSGAVRGPQAGGAAEVAAADSGGDGEVLSLEVCDETKGWMMMMFLLYHYWEVKAVYNLMRALVSGYVFLTGFGNTLAMRARVGAEAGAAPPMTFVAAAVKFSSSFVRINMLACCVGLAMGTPPMLYYVCPLHTFWTAAVYALHACDPAVYVPWVAARALPLLGRPRGAGSVGNGPSGPVAAPLDGGAEASGPAATPDGDAEGTSPVPGTSSAAAVSTSDAPASPSLLPQPPLSPARLRIAHYAAAFVLVTAVWHVRPLWEALFWPLSPWLQYRAGSMHEWWFRSGLDCYSALAGCAFAELRPALHLLLPSASPATATRRWGGAVLLVASAAWLSYYLLALMPMAGKEDYNRLHSYVGWLPMVAFAVLRGATPALRRTYSRPFAAVGRHSLELYLLQFHVWLGAAAKGNVAPSGPQDKWRMAASLLTTTLFWALAASALAATQALIEVTRRVGAAAGRKEVGDALVVLLAVACCLALLWAGVVHG